MKPEYEAEQIRVFGEMLKKGYIYRGQKAIYWSPSSETALAEAEIEYRDKRSPSIYVLFPVKRGNDVLSDDNTYVVIWTTTPWTIPANLAVALHEDFEYNLVEANGRKLVVAKALLEKVMEEAGISDYRVLSTFKGKELEGVICRHPLYDREIPSSLEIMSLWMQGPVVFIRLRDTGKRTFMSDKNTIWECFARWMRKGA